MTAASAIASVRRALAAAWGRAGRYRPELHYMRGPGPATLAKRGI